MVALEQLDRVASLGDQRGDSGSGWTAADDHDVSSH
jgi:hypothetical protein